MPTSRSPDGDEFRSELPAEAPPRPVRAERQPPGAEFATYRLNVNGREVPLSLPPHVTLLEALRDHLDLRGAKQACDHGQCGACTVLIDGRRVYSCLTLAIMHPGHAIVTVEGLGTLEQPHPLQQAFVRHDALQCGYCTPGQICSGVGLMQEGLPADLEGIRREMSGNLCRCGAYPQIATAIASLAPPRLPVRA